MELIAEIVFESIKLAGVGSHFPEVPNEEEPRIEAVSRFDSIYSKFSKA